MANERPASVTPFPVQQRGASLASGGGPPHDGTMEARVSRLEEHVGMLREGVAVVRTSVSNIEGSMATKSDVNAAKSDVTATVYATESRLIRWLVGATLALGGLVLAAARFIH